MSKIEKIVQCGSKTELKLFIKVQKNELKAKEPFSNAANVIGQKLQDLMKLSGTDFILYHNSN